MKVQVLHLDDCPSWPVAAAAVRGALDSLGLREVPVEHVRVRTDEEAGRTAYGGSPTILVDGEDLFPVAGTCASACRVYRTQQGLAGAPTQAQVAAAISERLARP